MQFLYKFRDSVTTYTDISLIAKGLKWPRGLIVLLSAFSRDIIATRKCARVMKTLIRYFYWGGGEGYDGPAISSVSSIFFNSLTNVMSFITIGTFSVLSDDIEYTVARQAWTFCNERKWLKDYVYEPLAALSQLLAIGTIGIIEFYLSATANVERENVDLTYKRTDNAIVARDLPRGFSRRLPYPVGIPWRDSARETLLNTRQHP